MQVMPPLRSNKANKACTYLRVLTTHKALNSINARTSSFAKMMMIINTMVSCCLTINIGYPKLFSRDGAGPQGNPARSPVNNFVAADAAGDFGWPERVMACYPFIGFPAPAGQVCERPVALTTMSFMDRPPAGI